MKIVLGTLSAGHAIAPSRTGGSQPTFSRARGALLRAVARGSTTLSFDYYRPFADTNKLLYFT